jgi:hypothetical protein
MRIRSHGNVFIEPLPRNGSTRYNILFAIFLLVELIKVEFVPPSQLSQKIPTNIQFSILCLPVRAYKDWNLQEDDFAWCFMWAWDSVSPYGSDVCGGWEEYHTEENIQIKEEGRNGRFEKNDIIGSFIICNLRKILSHVWVTIDGVWIDNWIYWTLTDRNYK